MSLSKVDKNTNFLVIFVLIIPFFLTTIKNSGYIFDGKDIVDIAKSFINLLDLKTDLSSGILILSLSFLLRGFLFLLPFLLVTLLELRKTNFKNTTIGRLQYSEGYKYADIWYLIFNLIIRSFQQIPIFLTLGLSLLSTGIADKFHQVYQSILPTNSSIFSSTFIFIILVLSNDLMKYFSHRLGHKIPLLWDLHEFHHSATEMTILSQQRGFAIEAVFTGFIFIPFAVLTSLALTESISNGNLFSLIFYIFDLIMLDFFAYLGHSSLKLVYPKPLSYIYMSPSLHWIHHSRHEEHWDCNFGEKYCFWDKIFNTYVDESHIDEVKKYGIEGGSEYNRHHPIYSYSVVPVLKILKRIGIFGLS